MPNRPFRNLAEPNFPRLPSSKAPSSITSSSITSSFVPISSLSSFIQTKEEARGGGPISPGKEEHLGRQALLEILAKDLEEADLALLRSLGIALPAEENRPDSCVHRFVDCLDSVILERGTRELMLQQVPGLADSAHMRLALHSVLGDRVFMSKDRAGHVYIRPSLAGKVLAAIEDKRKEFRHKKYRALDFLRRHQEILPAFDFHEYGNFGPDKRWPRQVKRHGFPPTLISAIECDLLRPLSDLKAPVLAVTGEAHPDITTGRAAQRVRAQREQLRVESMRRARRASCDLQCSLLEYLNTLPPNAFAGLVRKNMQAALAVTAGIKDERERLCTFTQLRHLQIQPQPFYQPSRRGRTVRIFPIGKSLLGPIPFK